MFLRQLIVTSKEIHSDIQELIKVKNIRAVYLGHVRDHPLIANFYWPRTEGILIKIDVKIGAGRRVCAIIDTGSQLNIVRANVAKSHLHREINMHQIVNMSDANGGCMQLQGRINDVDLRCGDGLTIADLWVSEITLFTMLLERPWQRGNLVSIDEREEGTYLIFEDWETRLPRFELLVVPHDRGFEEEGWPASHYQTFAYLNEQILNLENKREVFVPNFQSPASCCGSTSVGHCGGELGREFGRVS
jgi:hypothetical protein